MASPVLPTRPASEYAEGHSEGGWSDEDGGCGWDEGAGREASLAKRNLMDVLRSREAAGAAGAAAQRQQQHAYVHPQASLQHAARQQRAAQPAGSRPGSAGAQPAAKATRVSLAQLLAGPGAATQPPPAQPPPAPGARPASAGSRPASGSARPTSAAGRQALAARQNSGAKRGREVLAASRQLPGKPALVRSMLQRLLLSCSPTHAIQPAPSPSARAHTCCAPPLARRGRARHHTQAPRPVQALLPLRGAAQAAVAAAHRPHQPAVAPHTAPAGGHGARRRPGRSGAGGARVCERAGVAGARRRVARRRLRPAVGRQRAQQPADAGWLAPEPRCRDAGSGHAGAWVWGGGMTSWKGRLPPRLHT